MVRLDKNKLLRCCVACTLLPQNYFTRVLEDDIKAVIKPQYVDHIPKAVRGNVDEVLSGKDQRGIKQYLLDKLDLTQVRRRQWGSRPCAEPANLPYMLASTRNALDIWTAGSL
jgi:ATP-binding cassette subfamily E protein 1